ncbi:hypothetical protein, partial [Mesomycoplasma ovipneumoniae]|uniref:hypothetical protein n=1 Tax=Mesomycoplasma ovipneumoniae TaxID=29562 RepID=UPI0030803CDD
MVEQFRKLYDIVAVHEDRYPVGDSPYPLLTRLLEQAEETAETVNALEREGIQPPDPSPLADELREVLHSTLALARRYGVEDRLDAVIDGEHLRLTGKTTIRSVHKAVCYIIRDGHLLVFRHVDHPLEEVGIQV